MLLAATLSPSTRRAWIEILNHLLPVFVKYVALHPEGVDRNIVKRLLSSAKISRPPPGGRG